MFIFSNICIPDSSFLSEFLRMHVNLGFLGVRGVPESVNPCVGKKEGGQLRVLTIQKECKRSRDSGRMYKDRGKVSSA